MPGSRFEHGIFRTPEALYGVVGHPVQHSLSPVLHTWSFASLNLPAAYMKWDIEPAGFDAFVLAVRSLPVHGVSVTLPHKQRVIPYVDHLTPEAREIGAVNTLFWRHKTLWGGNTDSQGIRRPVQERSAAVSSALVLGAGGAALAAVHALRELGCSSIRVTARNLTKVAGLFPEVECVPWETRGDYAPDLLINATPLGMAGENETMSPWPEGHDLRSVGLVFDLIYTPVQTQLLQKAQRCGCETISGLEMFVSQALGQCELWTGFGFDPQQAKELLLSVLS